MAWLHYSKSRMVTSIQLEIICCQRPTASNCGDQLVTKRLNMSHLQPHGTCFKSENDCMSPGGRQSASKQSVSLPSHSGHFHMYSSFALVSITWWLCKLVAFSHGLVSFHTGKNWIPCITIYHVTMFNLLIGEMCLQREQQKQTQEEDVFWPSG